MLASTQREAPTTLFGLMRWSSVFSIAVELSYSLSLSLSVRPSYIVFCILPPTPLCLALSFPPSFLRPGWALIGLLGIKPWALETWGTFGRKMARGTVATYLLGVLLLALWKPSKQGGGFFFSFYWTAASHSGQHLSVRGQIRMMFCSAGHTCLFQSAC